MDRVSGSPCAGKLSKRTMDICQLPNDKTQMAVAPILKHQRSLPHIVIHHPKLTIYFESENATMPDDNVKDTGQFIAEEMFRNWFATDTLIYHCEFNKEHYDDTLFDALGIKYSESLKNAVIKRRAEFLAGRYCAKHSLEKRGINNTTIGIGKNRNPIWPKTVVGSISHCGNHAVAITGNASTLIGVGIDIEDEISLETIENIQHQIVNREEAALISQNIGDRSLFFTLAFSVKESFFKAAYPTVGQYFDFYAVSITEFSKENQTISFRINHTLHERLKQGMIITGAFHVLPRGPVVTVVTINH